MGTLKWRNISVGDPIEWVSAPCLHQERFMISTCAGRYIAFALVGSLDEPACVQMYEEILARRELFDDAKIACFVVLTGRGGEENFRRSDLLPGIRFFHDHNFEVSRALGAAPYGEESPTAYSPRWLLTDPSLRTLGIFPMKQEGMQTGVFDFLAGLPDIASHAGVAMHAPVLVIPRVFEPDFCQNLIALHQETGGALSGFMQEEKGLTVGRIDESFKRRHDLIIEDEDLRAQIRARINRRLLPEIQKAYQFRVTRLERYLIACYNHEGRGGYFHAHRDNTTKGTAHRRFAVTINLNAEEYDGGNLCFPEFGPRTYRAPTGGAVVFSCSLLHEAQPVKTGVRYCFLPFLYDESGAEIRERNMRFVAESHQANPPSDDTAPPPDGGTPPPTEEAEAISLERARSE